MQTQNISSCMNNNIWKWKVNLLIIVIVGTTTLHLIWGSNLNYVFFFYISEGFFFKFLFFLNIRQKLYFTLLSQEMCSVDLMYHPVLIGCLIND